MSGLVIYSLLILAFNVMWLLNHGPKAFVELYKLWESESYPWELSALVWVMTLSGFFTLILWGVQQGAFDTQ